MTRRTWAVVTRSRRALVALGLAAVLVGSAGAVVGTPAGFTGPAGTSVSAQDAPVGSGQHPTDWNGTTSDCRLPCLPPILSS